MTAKEISTSSETYIWNRTEELAFSQWSWFDHHRHGSIHVQHSAQARIRRVTLWQTSILSAFSIGTQKLICLSAICMSFAQNKLKSEGMWSILTSEVLCDGVPQKLLEGVVFWPSLEKRRAKNLRRLTTRECRVWSYYSHRSRTTQQGSAVTLRMKAKGSWRKSIKGCKTTTLLRTWTCSGSLICTANR